VHAARIAIEYRQKFKKDVVVDLICYRRHGHNEGDEPAFTQPLMYKKIREHETTRAIYAKRLEDQNLVEPGETDKMVEEFRTYLDEEFEAGAAYKPNKADWLEGKWSGLGVASGDDRRGNTSASFDLLKEVGFAISELPLNIDVH